ncbi:hypothetical protein EG340_01765 [Chryseobacterium indoltheticum]|uniref:Uncharacterized protein n=1 Tax=Chryseobacterium indoltheticum TaxID=254 RepID=A0A3G6N2V7_9FLAO|nr:hypothetical protein EG340_01765 [Chryseobacterium indoltheticum]
MIIYKKIFLLTIVFNLSYLIKSQRLFNEPYYFVGPETENRKRKKKLLKSFTNISIANKIKAAEVSMVFISLKHFPKFS